jgi:hypothetical protein
VHAQIVGKVLDPTLEHGQLLSAPAIQPASFKPRWAAICARPPAFIHSSTFLA